MHDAFPDNPVNRSDKQGMAQMASYDHDPNLRNLYWTLQYDPDGRPEMRVVARTASDAPMNVIVGNNDPIPVTLGSETITIIGNITVPTTVNVASSPSDPVHVHLTEVGSSGLLTTSWMPVGGNVNAAVSGMVSVDNFPAVQAVVGNVNVVVTSAPEIEIKNDAGNPISVSANSSPNSSTNPIYVSGAGGSVGIAGFPETAVTAFEEPLAVGITPLLQATAVYGLDPDVFNQTKLNGGNITVDTSTWQVSSGTSAGGYARLATARYLTYQPGQGAMFRWTAAFTVTPDGDPPTKNSTGITGIVQTTGPIDREDGYAIGYSGALDGNGNPTKMGILHRRNGKAEIRELTITVAPTGNQTATVTLNGVAYSVSLTSSASTAYTAAQLAAGLQAIDAARNTWDIEACGSKVTFIYYTSGAKNGTYGFSSTGTGTLATGTFGRLSAGQTPSDTWTYVDSWNGTVPSAFDPSKLNVFGVDFRWLGAGRVRFFMEDPSTGKMVLIHTQIWSGQHLAPHLTKPSLRIIYRSGSTSGATPSQNVVVSGASLFGAVQGIVNQTTGSQGYFTINSSGLAKDDVHHLLSIQNPYVRNNDLNESSLFMQNLTVANQGQDPSIIYLVKNAAGTSGLLVFNPIPAGTSFNFAQYSTTEVTENLVMDSILNVQTLGINSSATFNLMDYNLSLTPGDYLSVFISSSSSISRASVGITWKVD
jgi:hypothetical protein